MSRGVLLGGLAEFLVPAREIEARERRARSGTGVAALDGLLGGGWPRGAVSELCGARGQGRTGVLLATLAAAVQREETVALLDLEGAFDPWAARRAGLRLERLLWVRGKEVSDAGGAGGMGHRRHQRLLAAAEAIVAAGGFGLVALDLGERPGSVPTAAWLRLRRAAGAPGTVVLVVTGRPLIGAMGAACLTLELARPRFDAKAKDRLLVAVETHARLHRPSDGAGGGSAGLSLRHDL